MYGLMLKRQLALCEIKKYTIESAGMHHFQCFLRDFPQVSSLHFKCMRILLNKLLRASRKICDQSPENNLSVKNDRNV